MLDSDIIRKVGCIAFLLILIKWALIVLFILLLIVVLILTA